jgi:acetoin:2,6-dichlorophenolindophenol oxidoreductase subunit beta
MFFGVPGVAVVGVSARHDPGELLRRATLHDSRPVLFIEQKMLYAKRLVSDAPSGLALQLHASERDALYPTGTWRPAAANADYTIVTYGAMTEIVEQAIATVFDEDELIAEYHVVAQLAPRRIDPIVDSARRTGRLVVAEEATTPWGFGAEVVAETTERLGTGVRSARVGAHPLPIPNARPAEEVMLPSVADVVAAIRRVAQ